VCADDRKLDQPNKTHLVRGWHTRASRDIEQNHGSYIHGSCISLEVDQIESES